MELLSAVLIGSIMSFLVYRNLSKITQSIDEKSNKGNFSSYADFSVKIQEHIRQIKKDLDDDLDSSDPKYIKNEDCNTRNVTKELNDLIRKASFYETVLSKSKSKEEIESGFIKILTKLEKIVKENCIDGEEKAEELKEEFFKYYQQL
jgi:uncharacterized membrane protein YhiD involved in acid resistance